MQAIETDYDKKQRCKIQNIAFSLSYFQDEVREGFYLSSMMKRYWAAQLKVLSQIAKICEKYDIPWFADCGSLLGAVRHQGFIPWDDDLDICMLRHDLTRFLEVAGKELPEEYQVLNLQTDTEYQSMITRIVNGAALDCSKEHLNQFYGCPYAAGVDIFPLDGLMEDGQEEKRIECLKAIASAINYLDEGKEDTPECRRLLADIERSNHMVLHRKHHLKRQLLLLIEQLFMQESSEDAKEVALMLFWFQYKNHRYSKELFQNIVWLPFENTYLPVPARYDEVLRIEYGDYMKVIRGGGIHNYPLYRPIEKVFKEKNGRNAYRYTFTKEEISQITRITLEEQSIQMTEILRQAHSQIRQLASARHMDAVGQLLESCQSVAIALGTALEKRVGEKAKTIHLLEEYCEAAYHSYENWSVDSAVQLEKLLERIQTVIQSDLLSIRTGKKDVVFLPIKVDWWHTMEPLWQEAMTDENANVYVIPVPYYERNLDGTLGTFHDERDLFPQNVTLTDCSKYDLQKKHPDIIVIQYPYDGWNQSMDIPPLFYSSHLRQYTEKLVYLPCFVPRSPVSKNDRAVTALKGLIEQPAVVYADQVFVLSETMRNLYIETMTELSGENTRALWERKIQAVQATENNLDEESVKTERQLPVKWRSLLLSKSGKERKLLLYHTTVSSLLQYREKALQKIRSTCDIVKQKEEQILLVWSPHSEVDCLKQIDPEFWKDFQALVCEFKECAMGVYDENQEIEQVLSVIDAYYGDAGYLAHRCAGLGIPVMIQDMEI